MKNEKSLFESAAAWLVAALRRFALPISSALICGLAAHMFAFSNKLINADETAAIFSKGATLTSGRWGLELSKLLFPDVSMPWIYGIISLICIAAAAAVVVDTFNIKNQLSQALIGGSFAVFPALTGNFCYMFTSSAYALAVLLAVAAVWLFSRSGWRRNVAGCVALAVSVGVYQGYIAIAASLCVLLLIQRLLDEDSTAREVLRRGVTYLALLLASLALYYAVTFIVETTLDSGYQNYDVTSGGGLVHSLVTAYSAFVRTFVSGYFGYVNSTLSMTAHLVCAALIAYVLLKNLLLQKNAAKAVLALVLVVVYPLSVNCIYLIASVDIIHSLVLMSFVSFYVFAALAAERAEKGRAVRDLASLSLICIIVSNIFFANKVYLKMYLEYENAYAYYNTLMAQIMDTPGFSEYTIVDIVGNTDTGVTHFPALDTGGFTGPNEDLVNTYTRVSFVKYYLGLDLYMYREDEILNADWYEEMPCYPDPGSIVYRESDHRIVVKLG